MVSGVIGPRTFQPMDVLQGGRLAGTMLLQHMNRRRGHTTFLEFGPQACVVGKELPDEGVGMTLTYRQELAFRLQNGKGLPGAEQPITATGQ